jgi:hypothetical protein
MFVRGGLLGNQSSCVMTIIVTLSKLSLAIILDGSGDEVGIINVEISMSTHCME